MIQGIGGPSVRVALVILPTREPMFNRKIDPSFAVAVFYEYAASLLGDHGHQVRIFDALADEASERAVTSGIEGYDLIVYCPLVDISDLESVPAERQQGVHVLWNVHPDLHAFAFSKRKHFDAAVVGQRIETLAEIADALAAGMDWTTAGNLEFQDGRATSVRPTRPFESVTEVNYSLLSNWDRVCATRTLSTWASIGCPRRCPFCVASEAAHLLPGPSWQGMNPENVAEGLVRLRDRHDIRHVIFLDHDFFGPRETARSRGMEIATSLIRRGAPVTFQFMCHPEAVEHELFLALCEAGLRSVFVGIESGVDSVLRRIGKAVRPSSVEHSLAVLSSLPVQVQLGMLLWDEELTVEEMIKTMEFFYRVKAYRTRMFCLNLFNDLRAYAGTPYFARLARKRGLHPGDLCASGVSRLDPTPQNAILRHLQRELHEYHENVKQELRLLDEQYVQTLAEGDTRRSMKALRHFRDTEAMLSRQTLDRMARTLHGLLEADGSAAAEPHKQTLAATLCRYNVP